MPGVQYLLFDNHKCLETDTRLSTYGYQTCPGLPSIFFITKVLCVLSGPPVAGSGVSADMAYFANEQVLEPT